MRKTPVKTISKQVVQKKGKSTISLDDQLAEHLKQAEHHLIAAVKLFYGPAMVSRRVGYQSALERAQNAITTLYREELVRIRGPLKKVSKK